MADIEKLKELVLAQIADAESIPMFPGSVYRGDVLEFGSECAVVTDTMRTYDETKRSADQCHHLFVLLSGETVVFDEKAVVWVTGNVDYQSLREAVAADVELIKDEEDSDDR